MIRQLSTIKDEEAFEVLADILEPTVAICKDEEFVKAVRASENRMKIVQMALRNNPKEVMQIMSALSDEDEYHCTAISVVQDAMTLLSDKELISFFTSQVQTEEMNSSASASETTKGARK